MLSIVISWRNRNELELALPAIVEAARSVNGDITIVNYSGNAQDLSRQINQYHGVVRTIKVTNEQYFNKSRAQNIGARMSHHPLLFFCDCDIQPFSSDIAYIVDWLQSHPDEFVTLAGVRETEINSRKAGHVVSFGYELNIRTQDGLHLKISDSEEDSQTGLRNAPGLLFVRREHFLKVNGYNSQLHGWGWEDQDMIARLTLGAGLRRKQHGSALHISHDDTARIGEYPPVINRWESRDRMFRTALSNYDAAQFDGTYEVDTKSWAY